jgi:hypothetical protein
MTMRFMILVKSTESSSPPPQALMDAIAKLGEEGARAGVLVETGGLFPTAMGARVRLAGGKLTTTDGPFTEAKEVVGGYAVYNVKSKDEAVRWTTRFMDLHKEHWKGWQGEAEIRQIFEATEFAGAGK